MSIKSPPGSKLELPQQHLLRRRSLSRIFETEPPFLEKSNFDLKFISGPISWTGFEFSNKAIHFFGDQHYSREYNCEESYGYLCSNSKHYYPSSNCMTIDGLIKAIYETSEKRGFYADIFLESPYESQKKIYKNYTDESIGYISDIYNYHIERILSYKIDSKTNFHPIDIRLDWMKCDSDTCELIQLDLYSLISDLLDFDVDLDIKKKFTNDIVKLIKKGSFEYYKSKNYISFLNNLLDNELSDWYDRTELHQYLVSHLGDIHDLGKSDGLYTLSNNSMFRYLKMIESLSKKEITFKGKNISNYIQEYIENEIDKLLKEIKYNKDISIDRIADIAETFSDIGVMIMDMATLTKIFKTLEKTLENNEPQVLIVYAGAAHTNTYIKFFTQILRLKPLPDSVYHDEYIRCLVNPDFSKIFGKWIDKDIMKETLRIEKKKNKYYKKKTPRKIKKTPRKIKTFSRK
jgi:hypothetical protein